MNTDKMRNQRARAFIVPRKRAEAARARERDAFVLENLPRLMAALDREGVDYQVMLVDE